MLLNNKKNNSKGQVGDSLSWLVATIVIVILILFFVFGSSLFAETKNVQKKGSALEKLGIGEEDLFMKKSVFTSYQKINEGSKLFLDRELKKSQEEGFFELEYSTYKNKVGGNLG
jgi:hypothetical protein